MDLSMTLCEGRTYAEQLRGGQLALALAQRFAMLVGSEKSDAYAPWRALLSGPQQLRLRELDTPPTQASRMAQALWFRNGQSVPLRPQAGCWLMLGNDAWATAAEAVRYYDRCLIFSPFGNTPLDSIAEVLPVAVDTRIFCPPPTPPSQRTGVVLVGCGDSHADAAMLSMLQAAGAQVQVFDPYSWQSACDPQSRAALFSQCTSVVSAQRRVQADNHLVWEAVATGAKALALFAPAQAVLWDAQAVAHALQAAHDGRAPALDVTPVDWQTLLDRFDPHQFHPSTFRLEPASRDVAPHTVRHFAADSLSAELPAARGGAARVGIVMPGPEAVCNEAVQTLLADYTTLFVDTTQNPQFLVPLFRGIFLQQVKDRAKPFPAVTMLQNAGDVNTCIAAQLSGSQICALDMVHIKDTAPRMREMRELFDGMGASMPHVLVHSDKIYNTAAPPTQHIGASVASHGIVAGLAAVAGGRCHLTWLPRKSATSARGRLAFYPYGEAVGIDQDEIDYASLPGLLRRGAVDVLLHPDPLIGPSLGARALWADRAVAVVGMLHSIHAAQTATDAVFQLLDSPTYPFDTIISPSACGAASYAQLLQQGHQFLAQRMPDAPAFAGSIVTMPYGIDAAFYTGLDRASCRLAMDLPRDAIVLLSLGRLSRSEKADLLPLLLALRGLQKLGHDVFWVVGGGDTPEHYGDSLRRMAQAFDIGDRLRVLEDVAMYDKVLLYGAADIFVALSDNLQETYGLTVLEAMAAKLPVVASAWNGYRELVRHNDTGLLVPTAWWPPEPELLQVQRIAEGLHGYGFRDFNELASVDNEALLAALDALCKNRDLRQGMGERGHAVCLQDYHPITQAKRLVQLCQEKIAEARSYAWTPPTRAPFFDPAAARFGHYPTQVLDGARRIRTAKGCEDAAWVTTLLQHTGWGADSETQWAHRIVAWTQQHQGATTDALTAALASEKISTDAIARRVARCLKVGLLQLDEQSP